MRYAKVDLRVWHDRKFRELGAPAPNAQFLFLYLMTCPERTLIPGVIRATFSTVFQQFGWSQRAGLGVVAALAELGMVSYEDDLIWLPNALAHNRPANPNVVRGWRKAYDAEVPECDLRELIHTGIVVFLRQFPAVYRQAFHAPHMRAKAPAAWTPNGSGNGSGNGSMNGSGNGSRNHAGTVRRINSKSNSNTRTYTPPADAGGTSTSANPICCPAEGTIRDTKPFWAVLRLAQAHRAALRAEPTDSDRMEVLKTICAKHGVIYCGATCGAVLRDRRIAGAAQEA